MAGSGVNKTLSSSSNPASPLLTNRSASLERSGRYLNGGGDMQQQQQQRLTLTRQKSDMSHDRERPFVAVKRAHEQHIKTLNNSNGGQVRGCFLVLSRCHEQRPHPHMHSISKSSRVGCVTDEKTSCVQLTHAPPVYCYWRLTFLL